MTNIYSAPLQGFTDYQWRNIHNELFGGITAYYTPFLRIERGEFRNKDLRNIDPANNNCSNLVPQILASTPDKCIKMVEQILTLGYKNININLGCPFPPIAKKRMGSGMLPLQDDIIAMLNAIAQYKNDVSYSVKARIGYSDNEDLLKLIPIFKEFGINSLTIHPRLGIQQYKGDLDMDSFEKVYNNSDIPVIYNGDIKSVDDIKSIEAKYPNINGVMIGRGLLHNPALAREYINGKPLEIAEYAKLMDSLLDQVESRLQGDSHILAKMKPYWDYAPQEIDHKIIKAIHKSSTLAKYKDAIQELR